MVINYKYISDALEYYQSLGYKYVDAPWIVKDSITAITKPKDINGFYISDGKNPSIMTLVGSGEQSFIEMFLTNTLEPGKYVCCTPCFRDEHQYDELHLPYFIKVELINTIDTTKHQLLSMLNDSATFFEKFLDVVCVKTNIGYDIVENRMGIELGSYGIRKFGDLKWIYATGLAEPRLSQVLYRYSGGEYK